MKMITKVYLTCLFVMGSSSLYAPFSDDLEYSIMLTEKSPWGINAYTGASLEKQCKIDDLKVISIANNQGKAGEFSGKTPRFLLCPSLPFGVVYWNPVAMINTLNPCYTDTFSPLTGKKVADNCQGVSALVTAGSGTTTALNSSVTDEVLKKLASKLEKKFSYISADQKDQYKSLYTTIHDQLTFLTTAKTQGAPLKPGEDYFSISYLKFCSMYNDKDSVTAYELNKVGKEIFGDDVDVSSYFPNNAFQMILDLTVGSHVTTGSTQYVGHQSSAKVGGVLARAVEAGLLKEPSAKELLEHFGTVTQKDVAAMVDKYSGASVTGVSSIADRALLQEAFFVQAALATGLQVTAGVSDQTSVNLNEGFFSTFGAGHQVTPTELCTKLYHMSRYMRGINTIDSSGRTALNPQPVDTFYGAVILNQGTDQGEPILITTGLYGTKINSNTAGILTVSGAIDSWPVMGIDTYSGLKYRSVPFMVTTQSGALLESSMELQIDEGKGGIVYGSQNNSLTPAGVTIVDKMNNMRTTLTITPLIESFFSVAPTAPWGVVIQVVNEKNSVGQINPKPSFKLVGLVRFNPLQFPLTYQASDLTDTVIKPFTTDKVLEGPFEIYAQIAALDPVSITPDKVDVGEVVHNKVVTTTPTNINFVKYRGSLAYKWGATHSMQDAFKGSMKILKTKYFTRDKLTNDTLLSLVTAADQSQDAQKDIVKTTGKIFELFSIAAKDSL